MQKIFSGMNEEVDRKYKNMKMLRSNYQKEKYMQSKNEGPIKKHDLSDFKKG